MSKYSDELAEKFPTIGDMRRRTKEMTTIELPEVKKKKK